MATSKYSIPYVDQNHALSTGPGEINAGLDAIDSKMVAQSSGPIGSIPPSTLGSPGIVGREYYATDTKQWFKDYGTGWLEIGTFVGEIRAVARAAAPTGWLLCNGAWVSRTTYADLFAAIGTAYGAGDGSTTFAIPDLLGRVPVGVDGAAARLTANDALGQSGGAEKHTLTEAELPAHDHPFANKVLVHSGGGLLTTAGTASGSGGAYKMPGIQGTDLFSEVSNSQDAGSGAAHNNMPPYLVVNWIVKT